MAADLGWTVKWAQEVWRLGESHGLCRRDKQFPKRLYLCGKVKRRTSTPKSDRCEHSSRCTPDFSFVLPGFLERQMADWEPERRAATVARLERQHQWKDLVMRDGVAALRAITEQHDDRLLRDLGLEKRKQPKRREPPQTVRVVLLVNPEGQGDLFTAEATNGLGPAVVQPPPAAVHLPSPPDVQKLAPAAVQGGLYKGIPTSVHPSGTTVHRPQHGAQVTAAEADEATGGEPPLTHLLHHVRGSYAFPRVCNFENGLVTRFLSACAHLEISSAWA